MTKRIKITDVADVRPGDMVKMRDEGQTWRGKAWEEGGMLFVGNYDVVRFLNGTPGSSFVHATRKAPKPTPLPTTPGTVLIATVRGMPGRVVVRTDANGSFAHWVSAQSACYAYWHDDAEITDWEIVYAPGESK